MWTSFSVWSLEGRREHLKFILSQSSCVEDRKIKTQIRNKYTMHAFFKTLYFSIVLQLFNYLPRYPHGQGEGFVKQKANRLGQGEKGG